MTAGACGCFSRVGGICYLGSRALELGLGTAVCGGGGWEGEGCGQEVRLEPGFPSSVMGNEGVWPKETWFTL